MILSERVGLDTRKPAGEIVSPFLAIVQCPRRWGKWFGRGTWYRQRATGVPADGAAAGAGSLAPGQRWSASRKRDVVLRLLRGESLEALSREVGVEIYRLDAWRARAMAGLELGLKARHGEAAHRGAVDGDRAAPRAGPGRGAAPPFGDAEVATMSATTSAATGRCFGIQRVCQVWERSRSALYARRARAHHHRLGAGPARRGPPPRQSDAQLLAAIRTDPISRSFSAAC